MLTKLLRKSALCIFFPRDKKDCIVNYSSEILTKSLENSITVNNSTKNHIDEYLDESALAINTDNILIFGHPNDTKSNILTVNNHAITPLWFRGKQYESCFAYICNGKKIFSNLHWENLFKKWVSFDGVVYLTRGKDEVESFYKSFFTDIMKTISNANPDANFLNSIISIYDKHLDEVTSPWGDYQNLSLTLVFLEQARDKICSNYTQ